MFKNLRSLPNVLTCIALVVGAGSLVWARAHTGTTASPASTTPATESRAISIDAAQTLGDARAPLVLIEFADFQCSFCAVFASGSLPALKKKYVESGQVLFVFMHLPLTPIHPFALPAAEAAECAGQQGRFWPLHDQFFTRQAEINRDGIAHMAARIGLTPADMNGCRGSEARARVADQTALAYEWDIRATPAFLLGRRDDTGAVRVIKRFSGAAGAANLDATIDALLARR